MIILIVIESLITYEVGGGTLMLILFGLVDAPIVIYLNQSFMLKQLLCIHKWNEPISGGIHYNYKTCSKCSKIRNVK